MFESGFPRRGWTTLVLLVLVATDSRVWGLSYKYCIDPATLSLFSARLADCGIQDVAQAVEDLYRHNAVEFQRGAHELLAYQWLTQPYNPYRVATCDDDEAVLEYVPLLPLQFQVAAGKCKMSSLIDIIVSYQGRNQSSSSSSSSSRSRVRFAVASAFNMRTEMGTGMAKQERRGEQYDTVTAFVMSLWLGHYERWPQCPDLLRKGWKGVVEIPYVAIGEGHGVWANVGSDLGRRRGEESYSGDGGKRKTATSTFLFAGRLHQLYGPELVCSVRQSIFHLYRTQAGRELGLELVNITSTDTGRGVQQSIVDAFTRSKFCLVAKGDSYSSGTFYSAIHAGCIPVVISDWFSFAFPWIVPYEEFVIRLSETQFLMDPLACLQYIVNTFASDMGEMERRTKAMAKWATLFRFGAVSLSSTVGKAGTELLVKDQRLVVSQANEGMQHRQPVDWKTNTVFPFELMLFELAVRGAASSPVGAHQEVKQFGLTLKIQADKIFSCETPFHCASNTTGFVGVVAPALKLHAVQNQRSYLCTHAHRLIGMYKMVYFQGCVRILWPLAPGKLKPNDVKMLTGEEKTFIEHFHNVTARPIGWSLQPYPPLPSA